VLFQDARRAYTTGQRFSAQHIIQCGADIHSVQSDPVHMPAIFSLVIYCPLKLRGAAPSWTIPLSDLDRLSRACCEHSCPLTLARPLLLEWPVVRKDITPHLFQNLDTGHRTRKSDVLGNRHLQRGQFPSLGPRRARHWVRGIAAPRSYGEWLVTVGHGCRQPDGTRDLGASAVSLSTRDVTLHRRPMRTRRIW